jgi:hypothetical protein
MFFILVLISVRQQLIIRVHHSSPDFRGHDLASFFKALGKKGGQFEPDLQQKLHYL